MLSASAYSFRMQSRLAISLSWVAGYTNVITFVVCAVVTSHATGNVTHAARLLKISRKGLQLKMKELGLREREERGEPS